MRMKLLPVFILLSTMMIAKSYVARQILVQRDPDVTHAQFISAANSQHYIVDKLLVPRLGIYRLKIANAGLSEYDALAELRSNPWMKNAQLDHIVRQRQTFPDDTQFGQMWGLYNDGINGSTEDADIDAPEAWDIATGGLTPLGDTIVVAVVDGGCDLTHPDLVDNLWVNRYEIPGDSLDNDHNGYIDDVYGWNAYDSNGDIPNDSHGTHVCGTVGAKGNNGLQVTGVNWDVKIMVIAASTSQTSVVLEGYGYILNQRMLYNETNGDSGAFVVAANSSFGVDSADCSSGSYPLWNELYDAMGKAGILNVAATMNINANVDMVGDVPSGCDSDWLITVTNTDSNDDLNSGAAYGATMIDLGAPGTDILSTLPEGKTGFQSGTSMAAPHVAGAVGLMHNAMNTAFARYYRSNPGAGALALKKIILDGTDLLTALESITVSGGRLNVYNSVLLMQAFTVPDSLDPNPITYLQADTSRDFYITLSWDDPVTLLNGDSITDFVIGLSRDGDSLAVVASGIEFYTDGPLPGGTEYHYTFVTQLTSNDSISVPVSIAVRTPGNHSIPGDVTHDGIVDSTDIFQVIRFIFEMEEPDEWDWSAADVTQDSVIDIFDILTIGDIISDP